MVVRLRHFAVSRRIRIHRIYQMGWRRWAREWKHIGIELRVLISHLLCNVIYYIDAPDGLSNSYTPFIYPPITLFNHLPNKNHHFQALCLYLTSKVLADCTD